MNWARITNEEWREFQAIPEQGYSHRAWVDGAIRKRLDQLRTAEAIERAARAIARLDPDEEWPNENIIDDEYRAECHETALAAINALLGDT